MRLDLRIRMQLFFAAIAAGAFAALGLGLAVVHDALAAAGAFGPAVQGALVAGLAICALVAGVSYLFDRHVARPIETVATAMRARVHADVAGEIDPAAARYLGDLAGAASAAASRLGESRNALTESVARETARLAADRSKLEHLLGDVPPAVFLCTGRHHLVFYNGMAQELLSDSPVPVCLDRNLFDYLDDGAIRNAHRHLMETGSPDAVAEFICSTPTGARRLSGRMRLAGDNEGDAGAYVMTLRDVTVDLAAFARRDALLGEVFEALRPALAVLPDDETAARLRVLEERFEAGREEAGAALPAAAPAVHRRSVVYDFDLLTRARHERVGRAALDDLTYVVFDTETTGLLPERGDEIVQIAAVRIVNGRLVEGETFESFVNPGRPIPPAATAIHGVTDAMVADAPRILDAVARFHKFAAGAVLVAHNAPFDMEFLCRRESQLGITFANPVLDTVLLSAVVFGQGDVHSLDALAGRLNISLPPALRHTAMGDAVATAEAFLKLKAILTARGKATFADVLAETRRHGKLLKDMNDRVVA